MQIHTESNYPLDGGSTREEKRRGSDSFENDKLNSSVTGLRSADFVTENCLLKSVVFGSVVATPRDRQLFCSDGKIIH